LEVSYAANSRIASSGISFKSSKTPFSKSSEIYSKEVLIGVWDILYYFSYYLMDRSAKDYLN